MYPFEADMKELQERYGSPSSTKISAITDRINCSLTRTAYKHRTTDETYEALLYIAAAMVLGKIKKTKTNTDIHRT